MDGIKKEEFKKECDGMPGHAGTLQFQVRYGRERTNSEETAMILTAMATKNEPTSGDPLHCNEDGNILTIKVDKEATVDDDDEGWSSDDGGDQKKPRRHGQNRMKYQATKLISIEELREHFDQPIVEVARHFGICITLMKKVCRRNGIKRWPHRQIRSLTKSISSMEAAMMTANVSEREKYEEQIRSLVLKRDAVIADPNKEVSVTLAKTNFKDDRRSPKANNEIKYTLDHDQGTSTTSPVGSPTINNDENNSRTFILPASHPRPPPPQFEVKGGRWTAQEHAAFLEGIKLYGKNWRRVAQVVGTRNAVQTRTHAQKYLLKTSAHLEIHLALLNKAASVADDTSFDKLEALAASAQSEETRGLDQLSAVVAEGLASPSTKAVRDKLNFATPLVLSSASPRRNANVSTLRKLVLARKGDEMLHGNTKRMKEGDENASPNMVQ
ncbi:hypothetical protein THRCLA_03330 [Thraustotheca clavata]|uniref:Myb-like DNA-binding protein n=1 Tax=Thraustotheca clavata TaxID=74557 RepID=A0A1W0A2C3_9STRA|nr:hypothetical protein THRCLA_03330 [Thraustotheca clavata]